jgi:NifU-like protein
MWEYSEKTRDHFLHPRNAGVMDDANVIGEAGSLACGDALKLMLKVDEKGIIQDAKFQTFGCASAIASSSALTEIIKGMSMDEAAKVTNRQIADYLDGLPKEKMHCSVMGEEALEDAIRHWKGLPSKAKEEEGRLVCKCFGVTDLQIIKVARENNLTTVEEVTNFIKAGGACGSCKDDIQSILDKLHAVERPLQEIKPARRMTNVQRMQKVMTIINEDIAPRLALDGGSIELVDVDGTTVYVAMRGTCSGCSASQLTLKNIVEKALREQVDPAITVVEA